MNILRNVVFSSVVALLMSGCSERSFVEESAFETIRQDGKEYSCLSKLDDVTEEFTADVSIDVPLQ